jgi:hypothetical protein
MILLLVDLLLFGSVTVIIVWRRKGRRQWSTSILQITARASTICPGFFGSRFDDAGQRRS